MTASPKESPSVTSGLRESVQPTKPAIPIRFLYEKLPNVYVFSAHKMFTTFCAPFPNFIVILSTHYILIVFKIGVCNRIFHGHKFV